jgi:hypothetical protein
VIKDIMELVTSGMPAAAKEAIRETIAHTQTARGEPTLCNWLDGGHSKIHPCLQWFAHDAMYHVCRVLPEDQLVMVTMLWLHFIHVREAEPTDWTKISKSVRRRGGSTRYRRSFRSA